MKNQTQEKKASEDMSKVKEDFRNLQDDGVAQIASLVDNLTQSAEALTSRMRNGVTQLSEGIDKLKGDAAETVVNASTTVSKGVGQGLSQYNARASEVVSKIPGGIAKKAAMYPWVAISFALLAGFMLGSFLKPTRRSF